MCIRDRVIVVWSLVPNGTSDWTLDIKLMSLHIKRSKILVSWVFLPHISSFNCIVKIEGPIKVTSSHIHCNCRPTISLKRCKMYPIFTFKTFMLYKMTAMKHVLWISECILFLFQSACWSSLIGRITIHLAINIVDACNGKFDSTLLKAWFSNNKYVTNYTTLVLGHLNLYRRYALYPWHVAHITYLQWNLCK